MLTFGSICWRNASPLPLLESPIMLPIVLLGILAVRCKPWYDPPLGGSGGIDAVADCAAPSGGNIDVSCGEEKVEGLSYPLYDWRLSYRFLSCESELLRESTREFANANREVPFVGVPCVRGVELSSTPKSPASAVDDSVRWLKIASIDANDEDDSAD